MHISRDVVLAPLTSFKIGGKADYFCVVESEAELREVLAFARARNLPVFLLGGGTNILVSDDGFRGVVVKMEMRGVEWGEVVIAHAGENWDALVAEAVRRGLWGIENLSGIPGTVGAAPVQNIGAYGSELADVLEWVEVLNKGTLETRRLSRGECDFGYRDSVFKKEEGKNLIILRVALRLRVDGQPYLVYKDLAEYFLEKPTPTLVDMRRAVLEIRHSKFPDLAMVGTAGSFFKNPIVSEEKFMELKKRFPTLPGFPMYERSTKSHFAKSSETLGLLHGNPRSRHLQNAFCCAQIKIPLAWILDKVCGLKGFSRGNAALWQNQPLVLVNASSASASDVRALAEEVAARVLSATGISPEWEVQEV